MAKKPKPKKIKNKFKFDKYVGDVPIFKDKGDEAFQPATPEQEAALDGLEPTFEIYTLNPT